MQRVKNPNLEEAKIMETTECPECGCSEYLSEDYLGEGYRRCKGCGQEYWTDIDYSEAK